MLDNLWDQWVQVVGLRLFILLWCNLAQVHCSAWLSYWPELLTGSQEWKFKSLMLLEECLCWRFQCGDWLGPEGLNYAIAWFYRLHKGIHGWQWCYVGLSSILYWGTEEWLGQELSQRKFLCLHCYHLRVSSVWALHLLRKCTQLENGGRKAIFNSLSIALLPSRVWQPERWMPVPLLLVV